MSFNQITLISTRNQSLAIVFHLIKDPVVLEAILIYKFFFSFKNYAQVINCVFEHNLDTIHKCP